MKTKDNHNWELDPKWYNGSFDNGRRSKKHFICKNCYLEKYVSYIKFLFLFSKTTRTLYSNNGSFVKLTSCNEIIMNNVLE